jgi:hypothetical protein
MISLLIILICFFIFLFFLYYLSKDDFVIIRKDLALDRIFSMAILACIVGLICARLCFAIFSLRPEFINPLVFMAIPYHPGLSLIGGITGGSIFIYFYAVTKKIPVGRLFDIFIMSFIGVLPIGLMLNIFALQGKEPVIQNIIFVASIILLFVFSKLIFPFSSKGEIKDGSLGLFFILIISFIYFTGNLFLDVKNFSFLAPENIFILITFFASLVLIINQEVMNKYLVKK